MAHSNNAVASMSSKPTRKRTRATGKKPGKISWVHGTKETFFASRSDEWLSAQRMGTANLGKFYDDVTNLYIQKYGYDLKDNEDLAEDVPDPTDPNARDPDTGTLTQEEAARRSKISAQIRGRIGQWYRSHYGGGVEQGKKNIFKELLSVGADIGATQPARMQTWQYYSKLHYEERVKPRFENAWKAAVQRAKDLDLPDPHEVKATVTAAQNKEYAQILRAWEMGRAEETSHTPEELHATLRNAALYLQPLADVIQERFSMNVAIMLCGPIGELGGAIEVRSIHSGTTAGLNPKKWYQLDPVGYQNAEASMVRFSEKTFSEVERERRRVSTSSSAGMGTAGPSGSNEASTSTAGTTGPLGSNGEASGARAPGRSGGDAADAVGGSASGGHGAEHPTGPGSRESEPPTRTPCGTPPREEEAPTPARELTPAPPLPPRESPAPVHEAWQRKDTSKWSEELRRAHSAFAMGEKWPEDWARLVNEYMDFEAAAGYPEDGPRIGGESRPSEVGEFLNGGRKWHSPPKIRNLGKLGEKGSYADNWWLWWRSLQPNEREVIEETGMMTMPREMDWGKLTKMSGRNGFMQVMASLLWWGMDEFRDGSEDASGWAAAVGDVEGILYGIVQSGEVQRSTLKKGKEKAAGVTGRKRKSSQVEVEEEGRRSKRIAGEKAGDKSHRKTRGDSAGGKTAERPKPRPLIRTRR
ncbi:hypothetical protein C8F04DRAFT_1252184 [Mycena alexandri]|uniref:Uncharacterized protein n=1 Tax=Mycena alexandri TaxID=1745969 RepID=A0AAD6TA20_9AGAR|nr:hypothetical protein C8F04DRAFT_1252184 [Mycena alexandri]